MLHKSPVKGCAANRGAQILRWVVLVGVVKGSESFRERRQAGLQEEAKEQAVCSIDHGLESHTNSIDDVDWSEVECVKRSDSGGSGGVYFVQTPTQLVVVKPRFEPGMAVAARLAASSPESFSMPSIRTPKFRVISEEYNEEEWALFEEGVKKKMGSSSFEEAFWYGRKLESLLGSRGWTADERQGVRPAVMEYVKTKPGVASMADILSPELWCDLNMDGGCFCPAGFDKSLSTTSEATNCVMCAEKVAEQLGKQPEEFQIAKYLESTWVEEVCALSALDTFILEHDQMPILRKGPFIWQPENVMLSDLHAVSIDSSFLHGGIPVLSKEQEEGLTILRGNRGIRVPRYHRLGTSERSRNNSMITNPSPDGHLSAISKLVYGIHGAGRDEYLKFKGSFLTMLTQPASMFEASRWKQQCNLEQENVYRAPLGGDRAKQFSQLPWKDMLSEEALWNRCRSAMLSEFRFLARLDLKETLDSVLDQFGDTYCAIAGSDLEIECTSRESFLEFISLRQKLLRTQLR